MKNVTYVIDQKTIFRLKKLAAYGKRSASATIRHLVEQAFALQFPKPQKETK